jgi:hypothetical protein
MIIVEGELLSVGIDGCVRVWDLDAIDQADTTEFSSIFELDPMNSLKIPEAEITSMIVSPDDDSIWYAQVKGQKVHCFH